MTVNIQQTSGRYSMYSDESTLYTTR